MGNLRSTKRKLRLDCVKRAEEVQYNKQQKLKEQKKSEEKV